MELILQTGLEHQETPVRSVAELLESIPFSPSPDQTSNPIFDVKYAGITAEARRIQKNNGITDSSQIARGTPPGDTPPGYLGIDIKMETGTGKTYVYTHLIYELHRKFGINKFVVAVPSLAIKSGSRSFLGDPYVQRHFKETLGYGADLELLEVSASKSAKKGRKGFPAAVRNFADGSSAFRNRIYVLLVNSQLLTNGKRLSDDYDSNTFMNHSRPFDAIKSTHPFVIIDEPHRFRRDQTAFRVIKEELAPQCIIRLGATFPETTTGKGKSKITRKDYSNLIYDLNAYEAFKGNLIKGVYKEHLVMEGGKEEKVRVTSINAKIGVTFDLIKSDGGRKAFGPLKRGDSLEEISPNLDGVLIEGIKAGEVAFTNGQVKRPGEEFSTDAYSVSYQRLMLQLALKRHFEAERKNFERKPRIKTLALFFIDNIESYRGDEIKGKQPWLKETFEELLRDKIEEELRYPDTGEEYAAYLRASLYDLSACHAGYFAQDNSDSDAAIAQEVDDILHNKKKLLAFEDETGNPILRRFLFSKWTLKEGWDNPNVFTIAKLRSSGSEISKIQEVGRGLRLPVDEYGTRLTGEDFFLNYIVDFTERDFADKLLAEIYGSRPSGETALPLSREDLLNIGDLLGKDEDDTLLYLANKEYIKLSKHTVVLENLDRFISEFPTLGLSKYGTDDLRSTKVKDRNKAPRDIVHIRKDKYAEIRALWEILNRKYLIFYAPEVETKLMADLPSLFDGTFVKDYVLGDRRKVSSAVLKGTATQEAGAVFEVKGRLLPYNEYLKNIEKATNIPITALHKALVAYVKDKGQTPTAEDFKESSVGRFVERYKEWRYKYLIGNFKYKQTNYTPKSTGLTNPDGSLKEDVVQGLLGTISSDDPIPSSYLYDRIVYDSELEGKNIKEGGIESVQVFGKIPRKSIAIPTIDGSYSPDFMFVINRENGKKELNVVIETKDKTKVNLSDSEKMKISSAEQFFAQMKADGIDVKFTEQLKTEDIKLLLRNLIEGDKQVSK